MCALLLLPSPVHLSYLSFIGTAPEARGRGLGGRLLAEITSRADREGRWCLLEATSEKSQVRAVCCWGGFVLCGDVRGMWRHAATCYFCVEYTSSSHDLGAVHSAVVSLVLGCPLSKLCKQRAGRRC